MKSQHRGGTIVGFIVGLIVGLGAAAYAPAKYGLVTELVPAQGLVQANGWVEVSVVGAALLAFVGCRRRLSMPGAGRS